MNLHSVIKETTWDEVKTQMLFYCDEEMLPLFSKVYNELQNATVIINKEELIRIKIEFIKEENSYDVFGIKENDNHIYALSLSLWGEWLGYEIEEDTILSVPYHDIVAHCLWEMTYYGINEEEVIMRRDELLESSKKIENKMYIEESTTCPFCEGNKTNENGEFCTFCDDKGLINVVNILNES